VTVDIAAFTVAGDDLRVLLVRRGVHPFKGAWALPGGFLRVGATARDQGEDPRMRVITVAYYALIRPDLIPLVKAGGDVDAAEWVTVQSLKKEVLAFDHAEIIERAIERVAARIDTSTIAASLVPRTFTIPELRHVHSVLRGKLQDPGNFRRKFERMVEDGVIERAPGKRLTVSKPALVYRFLL
jgi:8-oxo-dGTP diphosphatase